jgi:hypothetical protein
MRRRLRRQLVGLACLAAAGLIGAGAIVDHRLKDARTDQAEVAEWYCSHLGTRCGGASSAGLEARWNQRQLGYEIAVAVLGAAGVGLLLTRLLRSAT